jgi:hypothetical protein
LCFTYKSTPQIAARQASLDGGDHGQDRYRLAVPVYLLVVGSSTGLYHSGQRKAKTETVSALSRRLIHEDRVLDYVNVYTCELGQVSNSHPFVFWHRTPHGPSLANLHVHGIPLVAQVRCRIVVTGDSLC